MAQKTLVIWLLIVFTFSLAGEPPAFTARLARELISAGSIGQVIGQSPGCQVTITTEGDVRRLQRRLNNTIAEPDSF